MSAKLRWCGSNPFLTLFKTAVGFIWRMAGASRPLQSFWQPVYPMGAHALMRAGFGANTLASATVYLLLPLPHIVKSAGLGSVSVTKETA